MHNNKKIKKFIHILKFYLYHLRLENYIFGSASNVIWHDASQNQCNIYIDIDWHSKLSFTICWVKNYHYFIIRSWWYTLINSLMRLSKIQKLCFGLLMMLIIMCVIKLRKWNEIGFITVNLFFFSSLWMNKAELCRRGSDVLVVDSLRVTSGLNRWREI